ncbi:sensor histidine kinase [Euzebya tangerina]|uniref:sensor histidine kinase n=1 Tax=Euzebya tangerina TaxID=591198 RepID=UPI0013C3758A|nr:ATP-binding protein [Euzebya tangerina]
MAPIPSVAAFVWRFLFTGLLALTVIVLATGQISRSLGEEQALGEARAIARLTGVGIVQPQLDAAVLAGDPAALDDLNAVVRDSVISGSLVRVKLWSADDEILYSDESRLIGQSFEADSSRAQALQQGAIVSEISDLSEPENRFERAGDALLEVYVPLLADETPVLYEAYFQLDRVQAAGREAWIAFAPLAIGALVVLQLVQVPIAWSMARRIRDQAIRSQTLLERALTASAVERRRISGDLHDGVVQDLTGISYELSGLAASDDMSEVAAAATRIRGCVQQLRSLLVDIYPPDLEADGLGPALRDLIARHGERGMAVELEAPDELDLPAAQSALLYRIAQEALRNTAAHAKASAVRVVLTRDADGGVVMAIDDDGLGFDVASLVEDDGAPAVADPRHFGLRILRDSAAELGGRLTISSGHGEGTRVAVTIPS